MTTKTLPAMIKSIRAGAFFIAAIMLSSCRTTEIIHYVHEPSESFYRDMNFTAGDLIEFKPDGVLFVVDVKSINKNTYIIWLGLYSEHQESILINEAYISGNSQKKAAPLNKTINVDSTAPDTSLLKSSLQLFRIESMFLERASSGDSNITLTVTYSLKDVERTINFVLEKRVERQTVFPT